MDPETAPFNRPLAARLRGPLEPTVLARTIDEIVRRHEVLRSIFPERNGEPIQLVLPPQPLALRVTNLTDLPESEREDEARRIAAEAARKTFDLARGPLLRAALLRLGAQDHILLLMMHHIVFDGWSEGILLGELGAIYSAFVEGRASPLPEPAIQYTDFAVWQQHRFSKDFLERPLQYWRRKLAHVPSALALQADFPRADAQTLQGGQHSLALGTELTHQLTNLARREGVTLFMVLLAAFQVLLRRYASQDDVLIGVPTAGRTHAELEGLIGCFMNVLVLRTDLSGNPTFRELLGRVRDTALRAYAHQELPFEKLVEELRPQRDPKRWPLFRVMFNMHILPGPKAVRGALGIEPFSFDTGTIGGLDLSLRVDQLANGLHCTFAYASDLFRADTIERMADNFHAFLAAAAAAPERTLAALPLLSERERRQLLIEWNRTAAAYPEDKCIHELFEAQATRNRDAVAVALEDDELTYWELNRRANRLAHRLRRLGVGPEALVGICVEPSFEMLIGILGILKAGGAYVPLDPSYPAERLDFMIRDAGVRILLTQGALAHAFSGAALQVVVLDVVGVASARESEENPASGVASGNAAYVIYTSGTTGPPKGVVVCHGAVCNHLFWRHEHFKLAPDDRLLQTASFSFDDSVWEFFEPLMAGARVMLTRRGDPSELAQVIATHGITAVCMVPSLLQAFLEGSVEECTTLRRVTTGGETLPAGLADRFFSRLNAELHNGYGPTEATIAATFWKCRPGEHRPSIPIGGPIANTRVYLLDGSLEPVPIGVAGELHIGGAGLARGYLNSPELTAEKFIPDPFGKDPGARLYKTGDLARYLPDGNIEFLGRLDHQIKLRGFRVEPGEIEAALARHAGVREAVVVLREDSPAIKRLVAYVVSSGTVRASAGELREFLNARLPRHMVPSAFVMLETLPLGPNGKIDRNALPSPEHGRPDMPSPFVASRSAVEQTLTSLWAQVLDLKTVGVHDNFFDLGGHSLMAMRLIARVQKSFRVKLSLWGLFESPTIAGMAADIERAKDEDADGGAAEISRVSRQDQQAPPHA